MALSLTYIMYKAPFHSNLAKKMLYISARPQRIYILFCTTVTIVTGAAPRNTDIFKVQGKVGTVRPYHQKILKVKRN